MSADDASPSRKTRAPGPVREPARLGVLGDVIGFRLRRIQNRLAEGFRERLASRDLKPGEFSALALVAANPGISQIQLAEVGGFDRTSVTAMVDDLERWGWVQRGRVAGDRRRHSLTITALGETTLNELHEVALENEAAVTNQMTARERERLYATLDRLYEVFFDETR